MIATISENPSALLADQEFAGEKKALNVRCPRCRKGSVNPTLVTQRLNTSKAACGSCSTIFTTTTDATKCNGPLRRVRIVLMPEPGPLTIPGHPPYRLRAADVVALPCCGRRVRAYSPTDPCLCAIGAFAVEHEVHDGIATTIDLTFRRLIERTE